MLFNSYQFIFGFLPVVLVGCFCLARFVREGAAQLWLTAASLYFYASWNLGYLPLLLGSILFNYIIATAMVRATNDDRRRVLLFSATAFNLALLGYYKYTGYLIGGVNDLSGTSFTVPAILLPLGISFYTFQQLTLLVDISQGTIKSFRFRDFLLFVIFFPHLIAGPIVHHREMMPQFLKADYRLRWENIAVGLTLFTVGLFKKVILADGIASQVGPLFADAMSNQPVTLLYAWGACIGFSLQMYFDFSGYSEMALGLARMVGIKLPMNFNSPLKAISIIEYWKCWHITLTRFLTAYVYNPLALAMTRRRLASGLRGVSGARTKPMAFAALVAVPTLGTMFLSGLWHGAGNQFLVFGLLHGGYLTINHAWRLYRTRFWPDTATYDRIMRPVGFLLTFAAASGALVFFRADSVTSGLNVIGGMAGLHGVVLPGVIAGRLPAFGLALMQAGVAFEPSSITELLSLYGWMTVLLAIALVPPNVLQIMLPYEPSITLPPQYPYSGHITMFGNIFRDLQWRPRPAWALTLAAASVMAILGLTQVTEFLYWQF